MRDVVRSWANVRTATKATFMLVMHTKLFTLGILMSYFVIFPISFRFLGTYSVAEKVHSTITLASYIETFTSLTFVMGIVFQLPLIMFVLAKMGFVSYSMLANSPEAVLKLSPAVADSVDIAAKASVAIYLLIISLFMSCPVDIWFFANLRFFVRLLAMM